VNVVEYVCCLLFDSDAFVAPSDSAVGQLMRRKSDLNYKILESSSPVLTSYYVLQLVSV